MLSASYSSSTPPLATPSVATPTQPFFSHGADKLVFNWVSIFKLSGKRKTPPQIHTLSDCNYSMSSVKKQNKVAEPQLQVFRQKPLLGLTNLVIQNFDLHSLYNSIQKLHLLDKIFYKPLLKVVSF